MINEKSVQKPFDVAVYEALIIVEREARKVLKKDTCLGEFVMGMGVWNFTSKRDMWMIDAEERAPELARFIDKWDDYLHLTGNSMRFTADGEVRTDW